MLRVAPLVLLALAACGGGPRQVAVRILVPDLEGSETPIPGVVVLALPYDRDSVLAALERRAGTPRPHTAELDSLFQAFGGPFLAFSRAAWRVERLTRERDSLARRRGGAAAGSPAAAELTARLRALDDSLPPLQAESDRARAALSTARDSLWPRMERLRADARSWEASTYAGYDTIVRTLTHDRLQEGVADTTGATGWATFRLRPGRWWVTARSPDPRDANAEWYWNLPVTGDTLLLSPATGRHRPRY
jgi:hypothetical protein